MEIRGRVHCFFEQSGTFKNEFIRLGIPAEDYDIQDNFGQTDHVIDLFAEIEKGYAGEASVFDGISKDDLIIAFFPCIYFTGFTNPRYYTLENFNYRGMTTKEKFDAILKRADARNDYYKLLYKMCANAITRELRLVLENPFSALHFLHNNFLKEPSVVDLDRTRRGDYFKKPTGYWFFGCENTVGCSWQEPDKRMHILEAKPASSAGLCSEERSMISADYARNFICDFIIGRDQGGSRQMDLF